MEGRKYPLESVEEVQTMYLLLEDAGFSCRWSGLCIWIEQELTDAQKLMLASIGARPSGKKQKFYIRAVEGLPKDISFDKREFLEVA